MKEKISFSKVKFKFDIALDLKTNALNRSHYQSILMCAPISILVYTDNLIKSLVMKKNFLANVKHIQNCPLMLVQKYSVLGHKVSGSVSEQNPDPGPNKIWVHK